MVITGFGGSDGDLSRAIAVRLATGFLHGQPSVPLPLRITMRGRLAGEGARELPSRHLGQAGLTIADWRRINVPTLVTIDGLDDLLPGGRPHVPGRQFGQGDGASEQLGGQPFGRQLHRRVALTLLA